MGRKKETVGGVRIRAWEWKEGEGAPSVEFGLGVGVGRWGGLGGAGLWW